MGIPARTRRASDMGYDSSIELEKARIYPAVVELQSPQNWGGRRAYLNMPDG